MKKLNPRDIFTIPNLICYFRILLIPVFCRMYLTAETSAEFLAAGAVFLLSSLTDLFDGMIARRCNMVTDLGKILDPVADKLSHAALAVCLAIRYPLMWALLALMLVKEGYMGVMGLIFLRKGKMLNGAMWFGKICTATLFTGLLVLLFFPSLPLAAVNTLIVCMMIVMLITLCMYIPVFHKMKAERPSK